MNPRLDQLVDQYQQDIISQTVSLLRFPSVREPAEPGRPFGRTIHQCLNTALALCRSLGFRTKNCDGYAGWAEIGSGSDMIASLVHLDVVPAGESWSLPPFEGITRDGRIYGRGVIDDKGPAVASVYALKALLDSGLKLQKRVRVIFGTDEENDWKCMEYYKKQEEIPSAGFSPDAEFPVIFAEKGILFTTIYAAFPYACQGTCIRCLKGGQRANMVPDHCTADIVISPGMEDQAEHLCTEAKLIPGADVAIRNNQVHVTVTGLTAHGSTPDRGSNAISKMMSLLSCLASLNPEQKAFIDFYNRTIGMETDGTHMTGALKDPYSGSLTLNAGLISMDENGASLKLNIRYPVTSTGAQIVGLAEHIVNMYGYSLDINLNSEPLYQEKDSAIVQTLLSVYKDYTNDSTPPISTGGGTYARSIPNAVAFGPVFPGREELAHCPDEYMTESDLILSAKIYAQALLRLAL